MQKTIDRMTRTPLKPLHVEQELLSLPEHLGSQPSSSRVRVTRSLVFCVSFVDRYLSFYHFFIWPLCCLSYFDLRILISPLISLNLSS